MRNIILLLFILLIAALAVAMVACSQDDDDDEEEKVDCRTPLTIFYNECNLTVSFNDVDPASFADALDSCANGSGKMWNMFIHCYRTAYLANDDDCLAWAECLPDHGFDTNDDDTADDDTTDDDTTDDDTTDDDTTDDDTTDDDTTDDDTTDDDTIDDDTVG